MYGDQNVCSYDPEEDVARSEDGFSQTLHNMNPQLLSPPSSSFKLQEGPTNTIAINGQTSFAVEDRTLSMEEISYHQAHHHLHHHPPQEDLLAAATAMDIELQQRLTFENSYNINGGNNNNNTHMVSSFDQQSNWVDQHLQAPDLLNLFNLPRCSNSSLLPNSSSNITFANPNQKPIQNSLSFLGDHHNLPTGVAVDSASASSVLYDPLFHLNLPPQPPLFRELFQSLPNGYGFPGSRNGSLFSNAGDEMEGSGGVYQEGSDGRQFENGVFQFTAHIGEGRDEKGTKHFPTDRQRRVQLNDKYRALRSLVPNPTKVFHILYNFHL